MMIGKKNGRRKATAINSNLHGKGKPYILKPVATPIETPGVIAMMALLVMAPVSSVIFKSNYF